MNERGEDIQESKPELTELWQRCELMDHPGALPFQTGLPAKPKPFPEGTCGSDLEYLTPPQTSLDDIQL